MTSTTTVNELAAEAAGWFETATRSNGESFTRTKEGAPEWVTELVYATHGEYFPDDWRYTTIRNALEWIADDGNPDDASEFAESQVDVYTGAMLAWLGSNIRRVGYVDDAAEVYGGQPRGILVMIGLGQYAEAEEVYGLVAEALREHADGD